MTDGMNILKMIDACDHVEVVVVVRESGADQVRISKAAAKRLMSFHTGELIETDWVWQDKTTGRVAASWNAGGVLLIG